MDDWKLLSPKGGDSLLFNLRDDPYEMTDLAAREPERLRTLQSALKDQKP